MTKKKRNRKKSKPNAVMVYGCAGEYSIFVVLGGGEEVSEELKALTNRMVSAILVTNPAPHILWGREELKVYFDCESSKLSDYVKQPDFPQPAHHESQRTVRWNPQEVIKWYKSYITKLGRPRAA